MKALGDNVILKEETKEEVSASGIILDGVSKERPEIGIVLSVGSKVHDVKEGDKVVFRKYAPDNLKIDGEEYLVVREEDIMAVVV